VPTEAYANESNLHRAGSNPLNINLAAAPPRIRSGANKKSMPDEKHVANNAPALDLLPAAFFSERGFLEMVGGSPLAAEIRPFLPHLFHPAFNNACLSAAIFTLNPFRLNLESTFTQVHL